jgi:hypothetical protein
MSPNGVNEDRVRVIVTESISNYELRVGNVRHAENLAEFKKIAAVLNKQDGSFTTLKLIGAVLAFLCMAILALLTFLGTHRSAGSTMITHKPDPTVATYSEMR